MQKFKTILKHIIKIIIIRNKNIIKINKINELTNKKN